MASDESQGRCPRCGDARTSPSGLGPDAACARCGLLQSRWASFEYPPESPALIAAWQACEADWSNPARHDALLDLALRSHGPQDAQEPGGHPLAALARRYHERPGDPVATARLGRIRTLLETAARVQIGPAGAPLGHTITWWLRVATYAAALVLLGAALWFLGRAWSGLVSPGPLY
ncbi:MAG TPA: hypothetical protein VH877_17275 [Polyangia bacterium]|jgi:hypothetical protein|nr:hypothetical protein [Polyangia bacterium]